MTAPRHISEAELHAYLDGDLAADDRAEVEAMLAAAPADAALLRDFRDLNAALAELNRTPLRRPGRPKTSFILTPFFTWAGVNGMVNPLGLESIVHPDLLPIERSFVLAHEWAHLAGQADEAEASAVGWLACMKGSPQTAYSASLYLIMEGAAALPADSRRLVFAQLDPGVRRDYDAVVERVLCIAAVAMLGAIAAGVQDDAMDEGEAERYLVESRRWLIRESIASALSSDEKALIAKPVTEWSTQERVAATWRNESMGVLLWALSSFAELPAYDASFERLPSFVPLLAPTAGFRGAARDDYKALAHISFYVFMIQLSVVLADKLDTIILAYALRPTNGAISVYNIASKPFLQIRQTGWTLAYLVMPAVASLVAARDAGAAVLVISDDLDEVMALGDRIAVMHGGHLSPARAAEDWTRETIGLAMAGDEQALA